MDHRALPDRAVRVVGLPGGDPDVGVPDHGECARDSRAGLSRPAADAEPASRLDPGVIAADRTAPVQPARAAGHLPLRYHCYLDDGCRRDALSDRADHRAFLLSWYSG